MDLTIIRGSEESLRAGAYYVRIQAMAKSFFPAEIPQLPFMKSWATSTTLLIRPAAIPFPAFIWKNLLMPDNLLIFSNIRGEGSLGNLL